MIGNITFNSPKDRSSIIKVIGVGGGGGNAVNHMFAQGIADVDFIICNTDNQALDKSPVPTKIRLGDSGLGAGANPEVGKTEATSSKDQIKDALQANTKMLFITVGMGGGTGTGAAPIIAQVARELDILTVGIVTTPFTFEGKKRRQQAEDGIKELRKYVDTLIVISNDKLREQYGNRKLSESFAIADDVLTIAAKGIAEIITVSGYINVDFQDVNTVMRGSGTALMGYGEASGEDRAITAVKMALASPLLNDSDIKGASKILLSIVSGTDEVSQDELSEISGYIQDEAGNNADIIFGHSYDEDLNEKISITVIATGFPNHDTADDNSQEKVVFDLNNCTKINNASANNEVNKQSLYSSDNIAAEQNGKYEVHALNAASATNADNINNINSSLRNDLEVNKMTSVSSNAVLVNTVENSTNKPLRHVLYSDNATEEVDNNVTDNNNIKLINKLHTNDLNIQHKNDNSDVVLKDSWEKNHAHEERNKKLRGYAVDLHSPEQVDRMEKEPAYVRREVELEDVPASDEVMMSNVSIDSNNVLVKRKVNSFLDPKVD